MTQKKYRNSSAINRKMEKFLREMFKEQEQAQ